MENFQAARVWARISMFGKICSTVEKHLSGRTYYLGTNSAYSFWASKRIFCTGNVKKGSGSIFDWWNKWRTIKVLKLSFIKLVFEEKLKFSFIVWNFFACIRSAIVFVFSNASYPFERRQNSKIGYGFEVYSNFSVLYQKCIAQSTITTTVPRRDALVLCPAIFYYSVLRNLFILSSALAHGGLP